MCCDGKVLNWTTCRMALFQKLVADDVLGEAKPLKTGNKLTVLVLAPRESDLGSFGLISKPMFKISHRGSHYVFNIACQGRVINPDLSYAGDGYFDISGVEPLDLESPTPTAESVRIVSTPDHSKTPLTSLHRTRKGRPSKQSPGVQPRIPRLGCIQELSPIVEPKTSSVAGAQDTNGIVGQMDTRDPHLEVETDVPVSAINDIISRSGALTLSNSEPEYMWFQLPKTMTGFRERKSNVISTTSHYR